MSAIFLPFSTPIRDISYNVSQILPQPNFEIYELFTLRTKLEPKILNYLGFDVQIVFMSQVAPAAHGQSKNDVMTIQFEKIPLPEPDTTVIPLPIPIKLTPAQYQQIESWVTEALTNYPDYALITYDGFNMVITKSYVSDTWLKSMYQYVTIADEYNPFIRTEGIYVKLNPKDEYITIYSNIVADIIRQLKAFYEQGYVVGAQQIAEFWNLMRQDILSPFGQVYSPTWIDTRIAPDRVNFLLQRIAGQTYINMKIDSNKVYRHVLAHELNRLSINFFYSYSDIHFQATTLTEAQYIASQIENTNYAEVYGQVLILEFPDPVWYQSYESVIYSLYDQPSFVRYKTDSPLTPYILSVLFSLNVSPSDEHFRITSYVASENISSPYLNPIPTPTYHHFPPLSLSSTQSQPSDISFSTPMAISDIPYISSPLSVQIPDDDNLTVVEDILEPVRPIKKVPNIPQSIPLG